MMYLKLKRYIVKFILLLGSLNGSSQNPMFTDSTISAEKAKIFSQALMQVLEKFSNQPEGNYTKAYIDLEYSKIRVSDGPGGYYILASKKQKDSLLLSGIADEFKPSLQSGDLTIDTLISEGGVHRAYIIMKDVSFYGRENISKGLLFIKISKPLGGWDDFYLAHFSNKQHGIAEYNQYVSDEIILPAFIFYKTKEKDKGVGKQLLVQFKFKRSEKGVVSTEYVKTIVIE